ncbi:hypothetical protein EKN06_13320 [Croceicoccus ponticola]|uniref:Uncharacterized protein n=1 Tax=Croceicoccus ponticola TaxID=2217664 RepID=A0A437GV21_9SPHN|nr:hypothetical protein [Croceicoccus ponticola]RVQ65508.1 hypothetical protein EKN06_13320 [Croceicoccus ponticola]
MSVDVQLHEIIGATEIEERFLKDSVILLRRAVGSPGFGGSVRQAAYGYTGWKGMHGSPRALDGDEIWDRIVMGRECGKTADHTLDLAIQIEDMDGPGTTHPMIGRTRLGTLPIRTARWFVAQCMDAGDRVNMAAHLMHQWMHVSGFVHGDENKGQDAPSVLARLVRRSLEADHGDEIDAHVTALLTLDVSGCDCCPMDEAEAREAVHAG